MVNKVTVQQAVGKDPVAIEVEGSLAALAATGERLVPGERFELPTNGLQNRCSTAELTRQINGLDGGAKVVSQCLPYSLAHGCGFSAK